MHQRLVTTRWCQIGVIGEGKMSKKCTNESLRLVGGLGRWQRISIIAEISLRTKFEILT
jgi:hypothetical protein